MDTPTTRAAGAILALGLSWVIQTQWTPHFGAGGASTPVDTAAAMTAIGKLVDQGQDQQAQGPATELYRAHPQNQIYIRQLAEIEHRLGHFGNEAGLWEQFLQYSPAPIEGCPQIGLAYKAQGLNNRAADTLNRCLAIESNNPDVLYALGSTYEAMGERKRAAETYDKGLAAAPNDADLVIGAARMDLLAGKSEAAGRAAAGVLARIPDSSDALLVAGLAALQLGHLADARANLEKGVQVSPRYSDIRLALGQLEEKEKHPDAALRQYRGALESDPGNKTARERVNALAAEKR